MEQVNAVSSLIYLDYQSNDQYEGCIKNVCSQIQSGELTFENASQ
ncbi:MAG: hypothetical protein R2779_05940 [Crocinitomicaceae bacterium]